MYLVTGYFLQISLINFDICLILQMQDAFKEKKTASQTDVDDTVLDSHSIRKSKTLDSEDDENEINEESEDDETDENNEIPK